MNTKEEEIWRALLAQSAPAFAGDAEPPYGLTARVLARARAEQRQLDILERIGLRAVMASLAVVLCLGVVTVGLQIENLKYVDPAINSMALAENMPIS